MFINTNSKLYKPCRVHALFSMSFAKRDIISITDFSRDELLYLCKKGAELRKLEAAGDRYKLQLEKQRRLAMLFYEPSTRTAQSFKTAIAELGGGHEGFSGTEGTSVAKKETIRDTIVMFEANHFDGIVMRNKLDGSVQWAADVSCIPVINGGDGKNEHPTQSLLDLFTLYEVHGGLDGIKLGFGGDLSHGRTVRSLSLALSHFDDITIYWAAADFLGMPKELVELLQERGVTVIQKASVEEVIDEVDFYYMTRPQLERMPDATPEIVNELMQRYKIDKEKIESFKGKVMHPLPVNSEIAEIDVAVYFMPCQGFFRQAENGIFMRKALLYEMFKDGEYVQFKGKLNTVLEQGNNRLKRSKSSNERPEGKIQDIKEGTVFDHLEKGTEGKISEALRLVERGFDSIPARIKEKSGSLLKTSMLTLTDRELKHVVLLSPDATINVIHEGEITEKYVYLLCQNENCVTRVINEDVPPKFYHEHDLIKCRYCRHKYVLTHPKVTSKEFEAYKASLPTGIQQL